MWMLIICSVLKLWGGGYQKSEQTHKPFVYKIFPKRAWTQNLIGWQYEQIKIPILKYDGKNFFRQSFANHINPHWDFGIIFFPLWFFWSSYFHVSLGFFQNIIMIFGTHISSPSNDLCPRPKKKCAFPGRAWTVFSSSRIAIKSSTPTWSLCLKIVCIVSQCWE